MHIYVYFYFTKVEFFKGKDRLLCGWLPFSVRHMEQSWQANACLQKTCILAGNDDQSVMIDSLWLCLNQS